MQTAQNMEATQAAQVILKFDEEPTLREQTLSLSAHWLKNLPASYIVEEAKRQDENSNTMGLQNQLLCQIGVLNRESVYQIRENMRGLKSEEAPKAPRNELCRKTLELQCIKLACDWLNSKVDRKETTDGHQIGSVA